MKARIAKKVITRPRQYTLQQRRAADKQLRRRQKWRPRICFRYVRLPQFKFAKQELRSTPITQIIDENALRLADANPEHVFRIVETEKRRVGPK